MRLAVGPSRWEPGCGFAFTKARNKRTGHQFSGRPTMPYVEG